jgi:hypothetical protein
MAASGPEVTVEDIVDQLALSVAFLIGRTPGSRP